METGCDNQPILSARQNRLSNKSVIKQMDVQQYPARETAGQPVDKNNDQRL